MIFGYARVSTNEQNIDLQVRALLKYGIDKKNIIKDVVSGAQSKRIRLEELLKSLREGDTLVVWKLDRLARSLIHFNKVMNTLNEKGVRFKSLTESFIDTTEQSAQSKFIINMFAVLAEMERDIIIERTKAGLDSAKLRGQILGRPKGLSKSAEDKAVLCAYHFNEGKLTIPQILKKVGVSKATYYKYLELKGLKGKIRPYSTNV
jgi:DNA invertase Pin-like site-specific DNA recombinase